MEEKIKGLYESLIELIGKCSIVEKLEEEHKIVLESLKISNENDSVDYKMFMKKTKEISMALEDYSELIKVKEEYIAKRDKIVKLYTEKLKNIQKEHAQLIEEKEIYRKQLLESEKRYSEAAEELKRLKFLKKKSKKAQNDELFCGKCLKTYFESENFNWSCRTHQSQISNDHYWCCNKTGKDTSGCIISKHITKEDLIDQEVDTNTVKYCSSCKKIGHSSVNCLKDPNIKSNTLKKDELFRLNSIKKIKRKNAPNSDLQTRAFQMVNERIQGSDFAKNVDSDEEIEELEGIYFRDLMNIKKELEIVDENFESFDKFGKSTEDLKVL